MSKAIDKRYMDRVAKLPCVVCGAPSTCLHHIRDGQGMSQRASNFLVLPLCWDDHQGPSGIHGDRSRWKIFKMDELTALAKTIEWLNQ